MKERKSIMDNQTMQKQQSWRLIGRRYFGRAKTEIPTDITMEGQDIHIKIKFKTKRDFEFQMVNGQKEMVPVEKALKAEEYHFKKTDIQHTGMAKKFLWYKTDYVMLVIALIAAFFTKGLFLLAGAAYLLLFVRCRQLIITLDFGQEIRIPISYLVTKQEEIDTFLKSLQ